MYSRTIIEIRPKWRKRHPILYLVASIAGGIAGGIVVDAIALSYLVGLFQ
jgi:hypothetical protein